MDAKFTMGPWGIEKTDAIWWVGPLRPGGKKVDQIVCSFSVGDTYRPEYRERGMADASLIAAAPDMLAALREAVTVLESWNDDEINEELLPQLRAAIAKAESA